MVTRRNTWVAMAVHGNVLRVSSCRTGTITARGMWSRCKRHRGSGRRGRQYLLLFIKDVHQKCVLVRLSREPDPRHTECNVLVCKVKGADCSISRVIKAAKRRLRRHVFSCGARDRIQARTFVAS